MARLLKAGALPLHDDAVPCGTFTLASSLAIPRYPTSARLNTKSSLPNPVFTMRYVRFLKTPRIVTEKGTAKSQVYCLITITSDLGDSFFPHDAELVAELINSKNDDVVVWRTVAWAAGMRTLAVTLPLKKSYALSPLRVRIGTEQKAQYDTFEYLSQTDSQGIVSAWSAELNPDGAKEAVKLVERRFKVAQRVISVWEETGESIARHLWYAQSSFNYYSH